VGVLTAKSVVIVAEKDEEQDVEDDAAGDSDDGEWITPSNYKKRLAKDPPLESLPGRLRLWSPSLPP
jgi:hypothetical protein